MSRRVARVLPLFLLLSAGACGGGDAPGAGGPSSVEGEVRTDPFRFSGAFDGEAYVVIPCADSEAVTPVVPGTLADQLVELHGELVPESPPGQAIFVDLLGEGVQEGDDVSFDILEVYRAGWEDWGCTWRPFVDGLRFAASGTEPDWTLHIGMDSTVVLFRLDDGTADGSLRDVEGTLAAGWTMAGVVGGDAFTLELEPEPCRHPMSGGFSHLTATFALADSVWEGCGFMGEEVGGS